MCELADVSCMARVAVPGEFLLLPWLVMSSFVSLTHGLCPVFASPALCFAPSNAMFRPFQPYVSPLQPYNSPLQPHPHHCSCFASLPNPALQSTCCCLCWVSRRLSMPRVACRPASGRATW
jgi:hypothetical protein